MSRKYIIRIAEARKKTRPCTQGAQTGFVRFAEGASAGSCTICAMERRAKNGPSSIKCGSFFALAPAVAFIAETPSHEPPSSRTARKAPTIRNTSTLLQRLSPTSPGRRNHVSPIRQRAASHERERMPEANRKRDGEMSFSRDRKRRRTPSKPKVRLAVCPDSGYYHDWRIRVVSIRGMA